MEWKFITDDEGDGVDWRVHTSSPQEALALKGFLEGCKLVAQGNVGKYTLEEMAATAKNRADQDQKDGSPSLVGSDYIRIQFQSGAPKDNGVNGCQMEDVIQVVIDWLEGHQASEFGLFRCRENALAITKLQEALHWLNHRTADRAARGVEGKDEP